MRRFTAEVQELMQTLRYLEYWPRAAGMLPRMTVTMRVVRGLNMSKGLVLAVLIAFGVFIPLVVGFEVDYIFRESNSSFFTFL